MYIDFPVEKVMCKVILKIVVTKFLHVNIIVFSFKKNGSNRKIIFHYSVVTAKETGLVIRRRRSS